MDYIIPKTPDGSLDVRLSLNNALHASLLVVVIATIAVAIALSRNVYRQSLRTQALRANLSRDAISQSDQIFLKSMQAEETVERILREEGWRHVFLRRRVPVARVGHNREIDVVAVGPVILVVEVKHWQGYVWSNGPRWFQQANVFGKRTLEFEDVQEDNIVKAAALRRYIENTHRIFLPDSALAQKSGAEDPSGATAASSPRSKGTWYTDNALHKHCGTCVVPVVIFTNPNVRLDPATVRAKKNVFTLDTFRVFAREALQGNVVPGSLSAPPGYASSTALRWAKQVVQHVPLLTRLSPSRGLGTGVELSRKIQQDTAHALDLLRTWDVIYFHDGRLVTGDILRAENPSSQCAFERQHLLDIRIRWNTGVFGLLKTFAFNRAGVVELSVTMARRLAKKKKEANIFDARGNVVFPIIPKRNRRWLNDRITVKPAGTTSELTFALMDIKEIRLSHHLYMYEK